MGSSSGAISPRSLRSDLYSFAHQEESTTPLVISVLASLLERSMARNERIMRRCGRVSPRGASRPARVFDGHESPDMEVQQYLERIFQYAHIAPPVYVVAYIYIDRLCNFHPDFRISSCNVHRLLIISIMVASKFVEDL